MQVTYLKAQKNAVTYHSGQTNKVQRNPLMIDSRSDIEDKNAGKSTNQKVSNNSNQSKSFAARLIQNQMKSSTTHIRKNQVKQEDLLKSVQITGNSFTSMKKGPEHISKDLQESVMNQNFHYQSYKAENGQDQSSKNKRSISSQRMQDNQVMQEHSFMLQGMSQNAYVNNQVKPIQKSQQEQLPRSELASLDSEARNYQEFIVPQDYYNQKKQKQQQKLSLAQVVSQDKAQTQKDLVRHSYKVSPSNWEQLMQNTASGRIPLDNPKSPPPKQNIVSRQPYSQRKCNESSLVKKKNNRTEQKFDTETNNSMSSTGMIGLHGIYRISGQKINYGPDIEGKVKDASRSNSQKQKRLSSNSGSPKEQKSQSNLDSQETFKHVIHINEAQPHKRYDDQIVNINQQAVKENAQATLYAEKEAGTSTVLVENSQPSNELLSKGQGDVRDEFEHNPTVNSSLQSKQTKRHQNSIQIHDSGHQDTFDSQNVEHRSRSKIEAQVTGSGLDMKIQEQKNTLEQLNPDLVDAKSIMLKNQGTSNPQLLSLISGDDLQSKQKAKPVARNMTSGTSEDNEAHLRGSFGEKSSNRYGNIQVDTKGFKLIGNRVKQIQNEIGRIAPIDAQNRPCITSHDNPRGLKYASSAASNYEPATPLRQTKKSPSHATKTNRGSVKSSGVFTQQLDSERPKNEKNDYSKQSSKNTGMMQGAESLTKMRSPSPIKLDKITTLAREIPQQRSLSQEETDPKRVQRQFKPIKRYPQQYFQLLSVLKNQNTSQASKQKQENIIDQDQTNLAVQKHKYTGSQGDGTEKYQISTNRNSLIQHEKLGEKLLDTQRRKSLDAASNSNIKIRQQQEQTKPIDIRAIRSQMHLTSKTDEVPRETQQFPEDAVLALVPYVGADGEIKETAVMLRGESSHLNNDKASTLIRNDPSSALFGPRSNSMQERQEVLINADIQDIIPYVSIRKHVSNTQQTESELKPNEDLEQDLNQNLPEEEFFTANAAEEKELFNYFEFRQRQKLAKSSNPFFNVQRKSQSRTNSVDRPLANTQLATKRRQILNERKDFNQKQSNKISDPSSKIGTKQAVSPNPNAVVQGVTKDLVPSPSPERSPDATNKRSSLATLGTAQNVIKCHIEKKNSVQDRMIRIDNEENNTPTPLSKSMAETEKDGQMTRTQTRMEEIKIIQDNQQTHELDAENSSKQAPEDAFITSVSVAPPKSTQESAIMAQKYQAQDMNLTQVIKSNIPGHVVYPKPTLPTKRNSKNNRQKAALENLKRRQQQIVEKDDVGKIILPVNSWEYRIKMTNNIGKKSFAAIKSRTQVPQVQLKPVTTHNIPHQLPSIRTDPTEDSYENEINLTNKQMFTQKSSEGRMGRRTVLQQHGQLSSCDDRSSILYDQSNQATFVSDQVLAEEGIVDLPSNVEIENSHEMAIFEENLISENFYKEEAAQNDKDKIFKDSWKINQVGQNFESGLYKEVLYLKEMKKQYEKNTNQKRLSNSVLDKSKLISTTQIPNIIGETNKGTIMKNRKPASQTRSFSLSNLNLRQISRRQEKRSSRNAEAYPNSQLPSFIQKNLGQSKANSSLISSYRSQDLLQIEYGQTQNFQVGPYAITEQRSQLMTNQTTRPMVTGQSQSSNNLPYPTRGKFSRLSSVGYNCDVKPNCDIKALRSKNLGSEHDPDPTSLIKLRFRKHQNKDKISTFSQSGPTNRDAPIASRRFGNGSFNETGFMSTTSSNVQHQKIVPHPDHMRVYSQTRQMTKRPTGHFKKYLNHL